MRAPILSSIVIVVGACSLPPESEKAEPPPASDARDAPEPEPLDRVGTFEGRFDPSTGEITVRRVGDADAAGPLLDPKGDGVEALPGSSSGVPEGGGVVAFSPAGSTTSSCPGGGTRCGPVRIVNRVDGFPSAPGSTVLRNTFAVVRELTPGWTIVDYTGDKANRLANHPGVAENVGVYYYEHLAPSDRGGAPSPSAVSFRGDRTWSFKRASGAPEDFFFRFDVYAKKVGCSWSVAEESPADGDYDRSADRDCDGVPGVSRNHTLFVDPVHGADGAIADQTPFSKDFRGSVLSPYKTLSVALAAASTTTGRHTVVIGGSASSNTSTLFANTALRALVGQFDATNGFGTRLSTKPVFHVTGGSARGISRASGSLPLLVEGIELNVQATSGPGYGIFDTAAAELTVRDVKLTVAATADGGPGTNGAPGADGQTGAPRTCATGVGAAGAGGGGGEGGGGCGFSCPDGKVGGGGGRGQPSSACGGSGEPGCGGNGGIGGANGGSCNSGWTSGCQNTGSSGDNGGRGQDGSPGGAGKAGAAASASATAIAATFGSGGFTNTSQAGGSGTRGGSGGGAGGGGGEEGEGAFNGGDSGGTGGSGGCGATAGTGGKPGNGAFGIFSYAATGANVTLRGAVSVSVTGSKGGKGGNGAEGGDGGSGSAGGSGAGSGGTGGRGGNGGAGAGGNGGPAICVVTKGTAAVDATSGGFDCDRSPGTGGAAGTGGVSSVAGATGYGANTLTF